MNKSNPLLPQGSLLEQQGKGRRRFQIWVYCGIAFHLLFLSGLLMLGCGEKKDDLALNNSAKTNAVPPLEPPLPVATPADTSAPPASVAPPLPTPPVATNPVTPVPIPPPMPVAATEPPAAGGTKEYKVVKGDMYYTIGKKLHVPYKAIENANPTIPANKLKAGMTIQIPASTAPATPAAAVGATTPATTPPADSGEVYTVKSGDNLTKIATSHHTKPHILRALNGLKTDRLKVGDKLKLPAKAAGATAESTPAPPPVPAPAGVGGVPVPAPGTLR